MTCPCGEEHPDHEAFIAGLNPDPNVRVTILGRSYVIPRVYIAAHGIKAAEVPELAERYGWGVG